MKRTIAMTEEELERKRILEQAIDRRITQKQCSERLRISERRVRQLIKSYREEGSIGLVSGHRGKPSNRRLKEPEHMLIVDAIQAELYRGFGPTLLAETLAEREGIQVSKETIRRIMIEQGMHKPKIKKKRAHPERARRPIRGELVQIDGSIHSWLEDRAGKACLIVFVDDATSEILAAKFVPHESFFAYGEVCKEYFGDIGVPVAFYSDRLSVFKVNSKNEGITQFSRAVNTLGIELICANSPQAKGRVERTNKTLQDRLVKAMRLEGISDYDAANQYLPIFLKKYNQFFAVPPNIQRDGHKPLDPTIDLDFIFSTHQVRIITKDLQIKFSGKTYRIITDRPAYALQGREVLIATNQQGISTVYLNNFELKIEVLQKQVHPAKLVDGKSRSEKTYSPPVDHPWRIYDKKINGHPIPTN